ncbi:hypothetical protein ON010_g4696 [Phytophthora cinnamomi]|nr:hypothetical protein ON010_g4696 [Phytophthora cinnamomi]
MKTAARKVCAALTRTLCVYLASVGIWTILDSVVRTPQCSALLEYGQYGLQIRISIDSAVRRPFAFAREMLPVLPWIWHTSLAADSMQTPDPSADADERYAGNDTASVPFRCRFGNHNGSLCCCDYVGPVDPAPEYPSISVRIGRWQPGFQRQVIDATNHYNTAAVAWCNKLASTNPFSQEVNRIFGAVEAEWGIRISGGHHAGSSNFPTDLVSRAWSDSYLTQWEELTTNWMEVTVPDATRKVYDGSWSPFNDAPWPKPPEANTGPHGNNGPSSATGSKAHHGYQNTIRSPSLSDWC